MLKTLSSSWTKFVRGSQSSTISSSALLVPESDDSEEEDALSRNMKQIETLASERDEVHREEFKASLRNNFIGDDSEFMIDSGHSEM